MEPFLGLHGTFPLVPSIFRSLVLGKVVNGRPFPDMDMPKKYDDALVDRIFIDVVEKNFKSIPGATVFIQFSRLGGEGANHLCRRE